MKTWNQLTEKQQEYLKNKEYGNLLQAVTEGSLRFDDGANGDGTQAAINRAWEKAEANQTPWFAHEFIAEEVNGQGETIQEILEGIANFTLTETPCFFYGVEETVRFAPEM